MKTVRSRDGTTIAYDRVAPWLPYDSAIMGDFSLPARRAAALTMPA